MLEGPAQPPILDPSLTQDSSKFFPERLAKKQEKFLGPGGEPFEVGTQVHPETSRTLLYGVTAWGLPQELPEILRLQGRGARSSVRLAQWLQFFQAKVGPTDTGDNYGPRLCRKVSWLNSLRSVAMTFGPSPCRPGPGLVRSSPAWGRKVSRRVYLPSPDPRKIASDQPWPLWACFGHSQTTGAKP